MPQLSVLLVWLFTLLGGNKLAPIEQNRPQVRVDCALGLVHAHPLLAQAHKEHALSAQAETEWIELEETEPEHTDGEGDTEEECFSWAWGPWLGHKKAILFTVESPVRVAFHRQNSVYVFRPSPLARSATATEDEAFA